MNKDVRGCHLIYFFSPSSVLLLLFINIFFGVRQWDYAKLSLLLSFEYTRRNRLLEVSDKLIRKSFHSGKGERISTKLWRR